MATTPIAANNLLSSVNPVNKAVRASDMLLGAGGALDFTLNADRPAEKSFDKVFEKEARAVKPQRVAKKEPSAEADNSVHRKNNSKAPVEQDKEQPTDSQVSVKSERQESAKDGKTLPKQTEKNEEFVQGTVSNTENLVVDDTENLLMVNQQPSTTTEEGVVNPNLNANPVAQVKNMDDDLVEVNAAVNTDELAPEIIQTTDNNNVNHTAEEELMPQYLVSNEVSKQVRQAVMAANPKDQLANNNMPNLVINNESSAVQANVNSGNTNVMNAIKQQVNPESNFNLNDVEVELETTSTKLESNTSKMTQQPANTNNNFATLLQSNTNVIAKMADKVVQNTISTTAVGSVAKAAAATAATTTAETATTTTALKAADTTLKSMKNMPKLTASVPVTHKNWGEAVMQNVMFMSSKNMKQAEINLDPPELGALQVKINTQGDQTSVQFVAHNTAARDVLEQNINRLREMMNEQGMQLVEADVKDGRDQQMAQDQSSEDSESSQQGMTDDLMGNEENVSVLETKVEEIGLVDSYA